MREKEGRVFLMRGDRRVGLGFFVDEKHLLTCAHVVAACFPSDTSEENLLGKIVSCEFVTEAPERAFAAKVVVYRRALAANSGTAHEQRHADVALLQTVLDPGELPFQPLPVVLSAPEPAQRTTIVDNVAIAGIAIFLNATTKVT